nr:14721_t:CDS:2 [Entrophospora candida]
MQASCEKIWTTCGWLYGKKRCNLSVEHVEALGKIHSYYVSNCKEELKIAGENISKYYPDDNLSDNESENLYEEEDDTLMDDDNKDNEEEYNSNELASSFMTELDHSNF